MEWECSNEECESQRFVQRGEWVCCKVCGFIARKWVEEARPILEDEILSPSAAKRYLKGCV